MLDKRSLFCCGVSLGLEASRATGLYLARTSIPKSAVAVAMVKKIFYQRLIILWWCFEDLCLQKSDVLKCLSISVNSCSGAQNRLSGMLSYDAMTPHGHAQC